MSDYGYPSAPQAYPTPQSGPPLSGWWRRVGASVVDGIIVGIVEIVLALAIGSASRFWLGALLSAVYVTALIGSSGRTVGNRVVSTTVVPDTGSGQVGYGTAFLRWLVATLLGVTVVGGILDILWPLWDGRNQTLHDKALNTLVVRTDGRYA